MNRIKRKNQINLWGVLIMLMMGLHSTALSQQIKFLNAIRDGEYRRIVTMGTSLTASAPGWPDQLQTWLKTQAPKPENVSLWNRGVGAGASDHPNWDHPLYEHLSGKRWALPLIIGSSPRPDVVFIEYSINDAYLPYQLSQQDSRDNLNFIIDEYLAFNPDIEIILMTMNNPTGSHLTSRPQIAEYYQIYRDVAEERNLLLIDHYPNWLNLYNTDPAKWDSYFYDGLHPRPEGSENVILPELIRALEAASVPAQSVENAKLKSSGAVANDFHQFGISVSLSGDVALVGADLDNGAATGSGAAYAYRYNGSTWVEIKLTASDGAATDGFGLSVSVSGNVAIVGAYKHDSGGTDAGAAYVYRYNGTQWMQEQKLTASDAAAGHHFGQSVSISGETIIVGAPLTNSKGAAYLFQRSGATWIETKKLTASDASNGDLFGSAVSIEDDRALVGAPGNDNAKGAAYIYKKTGTTWQAEKKLVASDAANGDQFGTSASISDDVAVAGAPAHGQMSTTSGAAYVFRYTGNTWNETKLTPNPGEGTSTDFGGAVAASGDTVVVGASTSNADAGAAHIYRFNGTTWKQGSLIPSDAAFGDRHGSAVAVTEQRAIVGAFRADNSTGSAYIFDRAPIISWPTPGAITFGTELSPFQLNATANVPGSFSYSPGNYSVLGAGTHPLTVNFTPANTARYATVSKTVTLTVNKELPVITWNSPLPITYGTALGGTQLNASANAPGTLVYSPPSGTVPGAGTQMLQVTLPESANYSAASRSVTIAVDPASLSIAANSVSRAAGLPNPPLTATYTGFVNGDTAIATPPTLSTSATSSSPPGQYPIIMTGGSDPNYSITRTGSTLTIADKEVPVITWSNPAGIPYGTPLGTTQLNATANVPGTFTYSPAAGTLFDAGTRTLTTVFTPTDAARYTTSTQDVTIVVDKITPTLTWNAPPPLTYGEALSGLQLNASSNSPAAITYTPPAGTVLDVGIAQELQATLPASTNYFAASAMVTIDVAPATLTITADDKLRATGEINPPFTATYSGFVNGDSTIATPPVLDTTADTLSIAGDYPITVTGGSDPNYTIVAVDGTLTVTDKHIPVITWIDPANITFDTELDATQLNATADVPGTFSYSPPASTILNAGTHILTATFTPTDTVLNSATTATVTLTVDKAMPTISWATPLPIVYGTALDGTQLNATASTPGTLAYSPPSGTVLDAGLTQQLQVTLPESGNYLAASAMVEIDVTPAPLTIAADDKQRYQGSSNPVLTASSTDWVDGDTNLATPPALSTTALTSSPPGPYPIVVTGGSDPNYTITRVDGTLTVNAKQAPTIAWNTPANIVYGTALNELQLNATANIEGTFDYSPASGTVLDAGGHTLTVTFTPANTVDYSITTKSVSLTVDKAAPAITWNSPAAIVYGTPLTAAQLNATSAAPGTLIYSPAAGSVPTAGAAKPLQVSLPESTNYLAASKSVTIAVTPAPLTIAADHKRRNIATSNPPLTAIYTGFVNGNTSLSTPPVLSTTAVTASPAGVYPIVVTGGSDPNYTITRINGALTVADKKTPTIFWLSPTDLDFGTPLSAAQLNAGASTTGTFTYLPPSGTVLDAGIHTLAAHFTPSDTQKFTIVSKTVSIEVSKITPTLSWSPPAAMTFGTTLGDTQLNATATVAGTFSYTPASGTLLNAGTHTLTVNFTPTDTVNYNPASTTVTVVVDKATPVITWSEPVDIVFGTALDSSQLNATANVPGIFIYQPLAGTILEAGTQTLTALFTPTNSGNYTEATATTSITVTKAIPVISWSTPAAITFGTALGAAQLNAEADVPGTFDYLPAPGDVLQAGVHTLLAEFTPADSANIAAANIEVTILVEKAIPTLDWNNPTEIKVGTALSSTQLNATASIAGDFSYSPASGALLEIGEHELTVSFAPTDSDNYLPTTKTVTIVVEAKDIPVITWPTPAPITFGTSLGSAQLNATASVPGTFTYAPVAGTTLNAGLQPLTATFTPTDTVNYAPATKSVSLQVNQATPVVTWDTPAAITFGTALGTTQLNAHTDIEGTMRYTPKSGDILNAGEHTLTAEFTPTDVINYVTVTTKNTLTVNKAIPTIAWNDPTPITFGAALGIAQLNATSDAPGTLVYTPPAGTILAVGADQLLTVSQPQSLNYEAGSASVRITVSPKQVPEILWNTPAGITYGTAIDGTQLNATAQIEGSFRYTLEDNSQITPTSGTLLEVGSRKIKATFTPTNTLLYAEATKTITIVVTKATPVITWNSPAAIFSDTALGVDQLNATATGAKGNFSYTPPAGTLLNPGSHVLTALFTPLEPDRYNSASATVSITVSLSASPWQNQANPLDVFADGAVDLRDISIVLILMRSSTANDQFYPGAGIFPDVDGDRKVTLADLEAVAKGLPQEIVESILEEPQPLRASRPQTTVTRNKANTLALQLTSPSGATYDLQYSQTGSEFTWQTIRSGLTGDILVEDNDPVRRARPAGFYRFVPPPRAGDFNEDGIINDEDIDILAAAIRRQDSDPVYDLTGDGTIHFFDMKYLVENSGNLNSWMGDWNLDGAVDLKDVFHWLAAFEEQNPSARWKTGDFDGDGKTTAFDFDLLADNFGKIRSASPGQLRPWHNNSLPEDVNSDGSVSQLDLLNLITTLNKAGQLSAALAGSLPLPPPIGSNSPPPYVDPDADGHLTAGDAILVRKFLNR
ncbi:MAG: MBG domain-containing protein [Verrucomicrobiales bacterium]